MGGRSKSDQSSSSQNVNSNQGVNSSVGMNYGVNQSGNESQNQSSGSSMNSSNQRIWGEQTPYLQDVYGNAQDQYGQAMDQINALQPQVQDQVSGAFDQGMSGYGNQMGGGFAQGLQGQVGENAYVDALAGDMMSDASKIKQQNLGGLDARAAAAGMSGSSGYRNQVSDMAENVDEQTMQGLNQLRFNSFNQGVQNNMNVAGMMDRNQQGAMANMGNMQQGAMAQFNPAMAGLNATGAYGNIIGGPTTLGSSSGSSSNQSSGSSNGFSNGMQAGMNMSGGFNNGYGYGASTGQGSSSSWTFDPGSSMEGAAKMYASGSDIRLKTNIVRVDNIDGVNMYTWDWDDNAPVTWPMNYGVIAQEVAETHPEAVFEGDHGYLMVDYSKLGKAGEKALARMEG
jgi:hypothetical protein